MTQIWEHETKLGERSLCGYKREKGGTVVFCLFVCLFISLEKTHQHQLGQTLQAKGSLGGLQVGGNTVSLRNVRAPFLSSVLQVQIQT